MRPDCVFIVGLPRTGTKLIRRLLESSPELNCRITTENFFLGRALPPFLRAGVRHFLHGLGDPADDATLVEFVDQVHAGRFARYGVFWKHLAAGEYGIDREEFARRLLASDRTDRGIYEALLRVRTADLPGAAIGDRTPSNLHHLPELFAWFPGAKAIQTTREPGPILASLLELRRVAHPTRTRWARRLSELRTTLEVAWSFRNAVRLGEEYRWRYPERYHLLRFEELVAEPEPTLRSLCAFLDIPFRSELMAPPRLDSSFSDTGGTGFDAATNERWRKHLAPWQRSWLRALTSRPAL